MPDFYPHGRELPQSQYRDYSSWGDITNERPRPLRMDPAVWGQQQIRDREASDYGDSFQNHLMSSLSNQHQTGYLDQIHPFLSRLLGARPQPQRGVDDIGSYRQQQSQGYPTPPMGGGYSRDWFNPYS